MNLVTQQNAAMVEQSTAAGHSLSEESSKLAQLVGQFQVGRPASDEALRRELMQAAPHAFRERDKAPRAAAAARPRRRASGADARQSGERRAGRRLDGVLRRPRFGSDERRRRFAHVASQRGGLAFARTLSRQGEGLDCTSNI